MSDKFIEKKKKARQFCQDVEKLAKEYDLPFFVVTDGASAIVNNGCLAVKNARESHILWKKSNMDLIIIKIAKMKNNNMFSN